MLGAAEADRRAVIELARRDMAAARLGILRHAFEHGCALAPRLGKRTPARDLGIDRGQILELGAALEPVAHDAGMQHILIVRQHQEIIENPALIGA